MTKEKFKYDYLRYNVHGVLRPNWLLKLNVSSSGSSDLGHFWTMFMTSSNIFDEDQKRNLNIIEVAYEVGYNNKVTFNKAFKKHMNQTPSTYIRSLRLA